MIEKRTVDGVTKFFDVTTTTNEEEITVDMIDSSITQIDNNIAMLQQIKTEQQAKKAELLAL